MESMQKTAIGKTAAAANGRGGLINQAAVRRFILDAAKSLRPGWKCTRVSAEGLEQINARLRGLIRGMIHSHPSGCGQTFRP